MYKILNCGFLFFCRGIPSLVQDFANDTLAGNERDACADIPSRRMSSGAVPGGHWGERLFYTLNNWNGEGANPLTRLSRVLTYGISHNTVAEVDPVPVLTGESGPLRLRRFQYIGFIVVNNEQYLHVFTRNALLGRQTRRISRSSDRDKSIRGFLSNIGSLCINVHAGRTKIFRACSSSSKASRSEPRKASRTNKFNQ